NNLLTAISGHCDLLLLRHNQNDTDHPDLLQISQNTNRAASLVGQLLAFSRKQKLQFQSINLQDALIDLAHLLNRLVGEKINLILKHGDALNPVRTDKRQLEQVLMNLVVNARDAMPDGGSITIKTQQVTYDVPEERGKIVIPPGTYAIISVTDEGHGIPLDDHEKIFEPFFTTKKTGEGTGLGLSTVYGIVKQSGGYIYFDSGPSKGTVFHLVLPAPKVTKPKRNKTIVSLVEPDTMPNDETQNTVVLLVEDEAPVRAFASRALQLKGYTVLEADCGETALDILADPDLDVDVFVTDVVMPGMDGPTWVSKAQKKRPDVSVVFVSGYPQNSFANRENEFKTAAFLQKPFSLTTLTNTVQNALN
ncbi:MAG: ATP-binding protein, partial [Pseudomonadota bacterium]